jgi:hypothetical protein
MPMSKKEVSRDRVWKRNWILGCLVVVVVLLALNGSQWVRAQAGNWTEPTVISALPDGVCWFPDLAVDVLGSVHVIWCQTTPLEGTLWEQVYHAHWNGESWSNPNDIVPYSLDIVRNAIATDLAGNVHLIFGGSVYDRNFGLYYRKAPAGEAWSAAAWSTPHRINQGISYMGDIALDSQGGIHVIYDDTLHYADEDEPAMADIYYRHSTDGGRIWSAPINLYPGPLTGSARPQMEIDSKDVIHVTLDEGWDRLSGKGEPAYSVYTSSADGGETWTPTTVITYPDSTVAQLTVGSNGQGGVMLVWRAASRDELFYQWSTDNGHSWGAPSTIPRVFARPWSNPFGMYDMATDSAGHIHLLVIGRESQEKDALQGVYHLVWDGDYWSVSERIFASSELYPEYPKIVVYEGNQLHAAWFTREGSVWDQDVNREVWYSRGQSPAPHQAVTPLPTPTPLPPTVTPSPTATITPYPTISLEDAGAPDGLYTDADDALRLAAALSPIVLLILIVVLVNRVWSSRIRR